MRAAKARAIIGAALLACAGPAVGEAACKGRDLFPLLQQRAPAVFSAIEAQARAMPFARGVLFRLSRDGQVPSYIFGSLHLSDPRAVAFSPQFRAALRGAKILVLETIETGAGLLRTIEKDPQAMRAALFARKPQRADVLLDEADFSNLKALVVGAGMKASLASALKPSILALLLDLPACARPSPGRPYADELIAEMARADGIEVVGLETLIEQVAILNGLPTPVERDLLLATLRQASRAEDIVETTVARYAEGEPGALLAWMKSPEPVPSLADARTPPAFLDRLIDQRNARMRERALPLLERGGAFIVVGAAHLPGDDGLLNLFQRDGFAIENVE